MFAPYYHFLRIFVLFRWVTAVINAFSDLALQSPVVRTPAGWLPNNHIAGCFCSLNLVCGYPDSQCNLYRSIAAHVWHVAQSMDQKWLICRHPVYICTHHHVF
jgi:hypothetical protein